MRTESYLGNAIAKPLNRAVAEWFLAHLIRDENDKRDPRLDLEHAYLAGLPPATLLNAPLDPLDPLRSDGGILQDALEKAGVPVERRICPGVAQKFFGAAAVVQKAAQAQVYAGARMARLTSRAPPSASESAGACGLRSADTCERPVAAQPFATPAQTQCAFFRRLPFLHVLRIGPRRSWSDALA